MRSDNHDTPTTRTLPDRIRKESTRAQLHFSLSFDVDRPRTLKVDIPGSGPCVASSNNARFDHGGQLWGGSAGFVEEG